MKKIALSLLIASLLTLLFVGCGKNNDSVVSSSNVDAPPASSDGLDPNADQETSSEPVSVADNINPEGTTHGVWVGDVYTNEYLGITFRNPEHWVAYTKEQIALSMGQRDEVIGDSVLSDSDELIDEQAIYDMMTQNIATDSSVFISFEDLSEPDALNEKVGADPVTEEAFLENLKGFLVQSGVADYEFEELAVEQLGGHEYTVLKARSVTTDKEFMQYFYIRRVDQYMAGIAIIATPSDNMEDILSHFE